MNIRRHRHIACSGLLATAMLLVGSTPARADLWGADVGVLTGILAEIIQEYIQVMQVVQYSRQQVDYWKQTTKQLDPRSFDQIAGLYDQSRYSYQAMASDMQTMGYELHTVDQNFRQVFPDGRMAKNAKFSDYQDMYPRW